MFRVLVACLLAVLAFSTTPASADAKIITVKSELARHGKFRPHHHRRLYATSIAVPRCRLVSRSSHQLHWRGLTCPSIAWAGSAPRQPWSYAVFRRHAPWDQRSELWQSHIRPSPTHPPIYWGY